ncbi:MAG: hypothetical protein AUJ96_20305 [Armatimonadetes bacterium CG2_30_66_41]|nr:hypothetical protein [Armatimonadota bacterium]OIO98933.1 MAG: hypothetical protein AUJ96_20305 [Armatimonadetes bacterium CG2_30_66_41]
MRYQRLTKQTVLVATLVVSCSVALYIASWGRTAPADPRVLTIMRGIEYREALIESLSVSYAETTTSSPDVILRIAEAFKAKHPERSFPPPPRIVRASGKWIMKGEKQRVEMIMPSPETDVGTRARQDFEKRRDGSAAPEEGGAGAYTTTAMYDGRKLIALYPQTTPGLPFIVNVSERATGSAAADLYRIGEMLQLYESRMPLSEYLGRLNPSLVGSEENEGRQCFVLQAETELEGHMVRKRWWVSPETNYWPVRQEITFPDGELVFAKTLSDWKRHGSEVWIPHRVIVRSYVPRKLYGTHEERSRVDLRLLTAEVNAQVQDDVFTSDVDSLPPGTQIQDLDAGKMRVIGAVEASDDEIRSLADLAQQYLEGKVSEAQLAARRRSPPSGDKRLCGPQCLLILCHLHGLDASTKELARLAGTDETGTTMYGLVQAAQSKGLKLRGHSTTYDDLRSRGVPAIVHMQEAHFIVVVRALDNRAVVIDPPLHVAVVPKGDFMSSWRGEALIPSPIADGPQ